MDSNYTLVGSCVACLPRLQVLTKYFNAQNKRINLGPVDKIKVSPEEKRRILKRIMKTYCRVAFYIIGARIIEERHEDKTVLNKWLGSEYISNFNSPYSLIVSNHNGWYEVIYMLYKEATGFVAKESFRNFPFIGSIASYVDSIFIDRSSVKSRESTFTELLRRQKEFFSGRNLSPMLVFPEGTTSSGHHILKLKRGAFELLQPLKSIVVKTLTPGYDLAEGICKIVPKFLLTITKPYHIIKITELPVIYPTEFMYLNYAKLHPEITNKAEVYAEVVREIWCEIGNFEKSDRSFRDSLEYISLVSGKKVHNT